MTRFWGDRTWKQAAYAESRQYQLFTAPDRVKQDNDAIVAAFRERLRKLAKFDFVPEPLPMKNSNNAVVYYLFFASPKPVAQKIIEGIFAKMQIVTLAGHKLRHSKVLTCDPRYIPSPAVASLGVLSRTRER